MRARRPVSATLDFAVVGAGIIGLATAYRWQQVHPGCRVAVFEKEAGVACHQTGHNSGVIHAGVYYAPGSLKAELCRAGAAATLAFCAAHGVPHRQCGKLIVATDATEERRLHELAERAAGNGLNCVWLNETAIRAREPAINGCAALAVADTGIADYPALCRALAAAIVAAGGELRFQHEVVGIVEDAREITLATNAGTCVARQLIVCGGLQSDRLARLAGIDIDFAIVPFRGDYFRLPAARAGLVTTLIYPVPDPALPLSWRTSDLDYRWRHHCRT